MWEKLRDLLFKKSAASIDRQYVRDLARVKYILDPVADAYFDRLYAMQRDWFSFENPRANYDYTPPENLPNLCGISANAIVAGLRPQMPRALVPYVSFGHYAPTGDYHFWSSGVRVGLGETVIVCATYGQFDAQFRRTMVIDYAWNLGAYGLGGYVPRRGPEPSTATNTMDEIARNNGIIPAIKYIQDRDLSKRQIAALEYHYRTLVSIVRHE